MNRHSHRRRIAAQTRTQRRPPLLPFTLTDEALRHAMPILDELIQASELFAAGQHGLAAERLKEAFWAFNHVPEGSPLMLGFLEWARQNVVEWAALERAKGFKNWPDQGDNPGGRERTEAGEEDGPKEGEPGWSTASDAPPGVEG